jgi:hypothetical protein
MILLLSFAVYTAVCTNILEYFHCIRLEDDELYLVVDKSIKCTDQYYLDQKPYVYTMAIVYAFGIPAFYFYALYSHEKVLSARQKANDGDLALEAFAKARITSPKNSQGHVSTLYDLRMNHGNLQSILFLWGAYLPKYYYMEVFDMVRKLTLTCLPMVIPDNTSVLAGGIGWVIVTIAVYQTAQPYVHGRDNVLMLVTQYELLGTLFIGLLIKEQVNLQEGWDVELLSTVLIVSTLLVILLGVVYAVLDHAEHRYSRKGGNKVKPAHGAAVSGAGIAGLAEMLKQQHEKTLQDQEQELANRLAVEKLKGESGRNRARVLAQQALMLKQTSGTFEGAAAAEDSHTLLEDIKARYGEGDISLQHALQLEREKQRALLRKRLSIRRKTKLATAELVSTEDEKRALIYQLDREDQEEEKKLEETLKVMEDTARAKGTLPDFTKLDFDHARNMRDLIDEHDKALLGLQSSMTTDKDKRQARLEERKRERRAEKKAELAASKAATDPIIQSLLDPTPGEAEQIASEVNTEFQDEQKELETHLRLEHERATEATRVALEAEKAKKKARLEQRKQERRVAREKELDTSAESDEAVASLSLISPDQQAALDAEISSEFKTEQESMEVYLLMEHTRAMAALQTSMDANRRGKQAQLNARKRKRKAAKEAELAASKVSTDPNIISILQPTSEETHEIGAEVEAEFKDQQEELEKPDESVHKELRLGDDIGDKAEYESQARELAEKFSQSELKRKEEVKQAKQLQRAKMQERLKARRAVKELENGR